MELSNFSSPAQKPPGICLFAKLNINSNKENHQNQKRQKGFGGRGGRRLGFFITGPIFNKQKTKNKTREPEQADASHEVLVWSHSQQKKMLMENCGQA